VIVEVVLFPGIVRVDEGVSVIFPEVLFRPDQNVLPRLTLCNVKVLLPFAPLAAFHMNWTVETVTAVYGLVIVMLTTLLLEAILISLVVMVLQLEDGVDVPVAVGVDVKVAVGVAVFVLVGIRVGVLLGRNVGVAMMIGAVAVAVAVLVAVDAAVEVEVAVDPAGEVAVAPPPTTEVEAGPTSTNPRIVRALDEVIVREPIGMSLIRGL
jgi:hypothetical protein